MPQSYCYAIKLAATPLNYFVLIVCDRKYTKVKWLFWTYYNITHFSFLMQFFTLVLLVAYTILLSYNSLLLHCLFCYFSPLGAILEPSNSWSLQAQFSGCRHCRHSNLNETLIIPYWSGITNRIFFRLFLRKGSLALKKNRFIQTTEILII